jgi:hypothetical protein
MGDRHTRAQFAHAHDFLKTSFYHFLPPRSFISKQMADAPPGAMEELMRKAQEGADGGGGGKPGQSGKSGGGLASLDESLLNFQTVEPEPAFVAKTVDGIGKKFFLNVCGHEAVDKPRPLEGGDRLVAE